MQLEDGAKFCPGCGAAMDAPPPQYAQQAPQQAPPPPPQQQYAPPPQQQYAPPPQQQYAPPPQQAPKKKIPKPLFVVIVIAVVIAVIAIAFNLGTGSQANKDYFDIGKDKVPSVKLVLGEKRNISGGGVGTTNGVTTRTINYSVAENQGPEMLKYAKALIDDYGFYNSTPNNFSGPTGKGFEFVKESVEEGYLIEVVIDYDEHGYDLTLIRSKGELTITAPEDPNKDEPDEPVKPDEPDEPDEPVVTPAVLIDITIPIMYMSFLDENEIVNKANGGGFDCVKNSDGTYTYSMTPEQQKTFLDNYEKALKDVVLSLLAEGFLPGLAAIDYNDDFSEVTITGTEAFFDDGGGWNYPVYYLGYGAPLYQVYMGKDNATTFIYAVNSETGEPAADKPFTCPEDIFRIWGGAQ